MPMDALTLNVGSILRADKDNRGDETVNKGTEYLFTNANKRRPIVVEYEHATKRVANVINDINRPDTASSRIEISKCHMIQVMHFRVK